MSMSLALRRIGDYMLIVSIQNAAVSQMSIPGVLEACLS